MKDNLIDLIVKKLNESKDDLKKQFFFEHPIKVAHYFALDNLLPTEIAEKIYADFPKPSQMRLLHNYGELKLKYSYVKNESTLLQDFHKAIQDPQVIAVIEEITEIKNQVSDKTRLAGGISSLLKGHYINPHLDNSHDIDKKLYQTVNLLYYVSPNWKLENGGHYEVWDPEVKNCIVVPSFFNRLVVMGASQTAWHAVSPVLCNSPRCCIFNYYYSETSPVGEEFFHKSSALFNPLIKPRPEQKIRRAVKDMLLKVW